MKKLFTLLIAGSLLSQTAAATAACDAKALAREARAYRMQANDMQMIADDFREMHESAAKDAKNSIVLAVSSLALLFVGEGLIASSGAEAVSSMGVVGRGAYAHSQLTEGAAQVIANRIQNEFVAAIPVVLSPAVTVPAVDPIVASVLIDLRFPEDTIDQTRAEVARLNEEDLFQQYEAAKKLQGDLIDQAPNQFLDGLSLGTLDKRWTFKTYTNMQKIADLAKQIADVKTSRALSCE
jgi:hypothetical protein